MATTTHRLPKNDEQLKALAMAMIAGMARADALVAKHTASPTMLALCGLEGYVPSIQCLTARGARKAELTELADRYDDFQVRYGDRRRAFRC